MSDLAKDPPEDLFPINIIAGGLKLASDELHKKKTRLKKICYIYVRTRFFKRCLYEIIK